MKNSLFNRIAFLAAMFSATFMFQACDPFGVKATGDDITQVINEKNFHGIELEVPARVEVYVDSVYKLEVTCEESAMPYLETRVSDGILKVYFNRNIRDLDNMKIVVSAPSWDYFEVDGSGSIRILDAISGHELEVDISGSGNLSAHQAVFTKADLEVSGSGDLKLGGSASHLEADISGSGNIDCLDFPVQTADVEVSGSGRMKLNVIEHLKAEVSGSGDINYTGDPQLNVKITGSGNVKKI